jgi:hypothetical protein
MKKINCFLLLVAALWSTTAVADVVFDETNFPDEGFREAIADAYWEDYDIRLNDGDILTDEMLNMRIDLAADDYGIDNVIGIEYLTGLYSAVFLMNYIEEIDLSHNPNLVSLDLGRNPLKSINLSGCTQLINISIFPYPNHEGELEELDLSDCVSLKSIDINEPLKQLDLSHNTLVENISFEKLDITGMLDLRNCKKLTTITLDGCNQLTGVQFYTPDPTNPTDIALSQGIHKAALSGNEKLSFITTQNQIFLDSFYINCSNITNLEFTGCSSLRALYIGRNDYLETVDISDCENLESLDIYENPILEEFDLSNNTYLKSLYLRDCPSIKRLIGLRQTASTLESLRVSNELTSLDLNDFPKLNYLDISVSISSQYHSPANHLNAINLENDNNLQTFHHEVMNGRQIQVYYTDADGEKQYFIPIATTAAHKGIKDLIEQENNYEDEDTGFDWANVVTESITGATLGELDGEAVLWLDKTTNSDTEGLHRMTYQYLTHAPTTAFPDQYPTTEFYLDWAEDTGKRGDVNGDGEVDINDVTLLIDVILGKSVEYNATAADCNTASSDGTIDINDVTALINYVLAGNW